MIETDARVVAIADGRTWVEADRQSACGACSSASGCGSALFARLWGGRPVRVEVDNPVDARPGQQVVIGVPERVMLTGSLWLYLVPLAGLMLGALVGQWLGQGFAPGQAESAEWPAMLGALLGLWLAPRIRRFWVHDALVVRPVILRNRRQDMRVPLAGVYEEKS